MSHNIGPIPKVVVATTLSFGAIGAAVGGAIDHLASEGIHKTWVVEQTTYTYTDVKREDKKAKRNLDKAKKEAEANINNLLDEKCSSAIRPYRYGGEFADVTEEGAVSDLVGDPKLPCQNWRRQVRAIIRYARSQDAITQEKREGAKLRGLHLQEFKGYEEDDKNFPGALAGGLAFGVFGLVHSLGPEALRRTSKNKNDRNENAAVGQGEEPRTETKVSNGDDA